MILSISPPRRIMEECNGNAAERTPPNKQSLAITLQELVKTREEIKQARESAVLSWLGPIATIDELETSKCDLSRTGNKVTLSNTAIASLRSLLDSTNRSDKQMRAEDAKSRRAIKQMQEEMERKGQEVERLKVELGLQDASRSKLRTELQIKRQTLATLLLGEKAVRLEIEALDASMSVALRQRKSLQADNTMISLSHEEYNDLCTQAEEETASANSQIILWDEERRLAEIRKAGALQKLEAIQRGKGGSMSRDVLGVSAADEDKGKLHLESAKKTPQAKTESSPEMLKDTKRRSRRKSNKKKGRKKLSILSRMRNLCMRLFK